MNIIENQKKSNRTILNNLNIVLIFVLFFVSLMLSFFSMSILMWFNTIIIVIFILNILFSKIKKYQYSIETFDKMDEFFSKNKQKKHLFIVFWKLFVVLLLNSILNIINTYVLGYSYDIPMSIVIELFFFSISWNIVKILSPIFTSYDYTSEYLFDSQRSFLIRVWTYIVLRPEAYKNNKYTIGYQVWKKNGEKITQEQLNIAKKQLENYDWNFLNKLKYNILSPKDFKTNPIISFKEILDFCSVVLSFVGFEAFVRILRNEKIIEINLNLIIKFLVFCLFACFCWRVLSRYKLKTHLERYLPTLINEELERRKI